jgi:hydrogenase expression/formation protein HypC
MCLAIPAKIIEINIDKSAKVDYGGIKKIIRLDLLDAKVNDYVLIHAGFAIEKMDKKSAIKTINDIKKLIKNN